MSAYNINEIVDFVRWFTDKAKQEFPELDITVALYSEAHWPECEGVTLDYIAEAFPHVTDPDLSDIVKDSGSAAATRCVLRDADDPDRTTMIMKVNLDQCTLMGQGDTLKGLKAGVSHEMGHVLGLYYRGRQMGSLLEENGADMFELLVMNALGYDNHAETLLERRVLDVENPNKLNVSRCYGFPTVYEDAKALAENYQGQDITALRFADVLDEVEDFMEPRREAFDQWFACADAIFALRYEARDDADLLGAAMHANYPHAQLMSDVSGIIPNMDFKPQHDPNPFAYRMAAHNYPTPARSLSSLVSAHATLESVGSAHDDTNAVGGGFAVLYADGTYDGTYSLDESKPDSELSFS